MQAPAKQRDPRLDFFRGAAMLIIFMAHVPDNAWNLYIPAQFGFSDAAEMFVFCSGFAAAIAFGGTFVKAGFVHGTARILYRCWQLYFAHVLMFFGIAALMVAATGWGTGVNYIELLNLTYFFENTQAALVGLFTLTYVPNYFDILPMYIVALAMVPAMMLLARLHPWLAVAASIGVYLASWALHVGLPARPGSTEFVWFFNPFGWQLVFFTGYALSAGWITPPRPNRWLTAAAVVMVVWPMPVVNWSIFYDLRDAFPVFMETHDLLIPWIEKTNYGILRLVHFLALAYLTLLILRGREHLLLSPLCRPVLVIGQQALQSFLLSMILAQAAGILLDAIGRGGASLALINLGGFVVIFGFARLVAWIKASPWKAAAMRRANAAPAERRFAGGGAMQAAE